MSGSEILQAIQKLPFSEQRALAEQLQQSLSAAEALTADTAAQREREFELEMLTEDQVRRYLSALSATGAVGGNGLRAFDVNNGLMVKIEQAVGGPTA
jgi:hypothetical protein